MVGLPRRGGDVQNRLQSTKRKMLGIATEPDNELSTGQTQIKHPRGKLHDPVEFLILAQDAPERMRKRPAAMVRSLEKEFTMTSLNTVADFDIPAWAVLALANGPIFGSEQEGGFHTLGDVLVDRTADGVPLHKVWDDQRDLLRLLPVTALSALCITPL